MTLDLDNGLPPIHIIFGASDTNEAEFCTHVDSCAGMNVGNLKLHPCIMTTNPDIVDRYIKFDDENTFGPIRLNCTLDEEKNNLKGPLTSMVTYITSYKDSNNKNHTRLLRPPERCSSKFYH